MGVKMSVSYRNQTWSAQWESYSQSSYVYNGVTAWLPHIGSKTFECAGKLMHTDFVFGGVHTLACAGKVMRDDVTMTSEDYTPTVTLTITGNGNYDLCDVEYPSGSGNWLYTNQTITMPKGTVIKLWVKGSNLSQGEIHVNGTQVVKTKTTGEYNITMNSNGTAVLNYQSTWLYSFGTIDFTGGT